MVSDNNILWLIPSDILIYHILQDNGTLLELIGVNKYLTQCVKNILINRYKKYNIQPVDCFLMERFLHLNCNATDAKQLYKVSKHDLESLPHTQGKRKNTKMYNLQSIVKICYPKFKSLQALLQHQNKVIKLRDEKLIVQRERDRKRNEAKRKEIVDNKLRSFKPVANDKLMNQLFCNDSFLLNECERYIHIEGSDSFLLNECERYIHTDYFF
jgi:hypothetical protein